MPWRRKKPTFTDAIVEMIGLFSRGARQEGLLPAGEGLSRGQMIVAIAMATDTAIVEWWGSAAQERLALVVAATARAILLDHRVYVVSPTEAGARATAAVATTLTRRFGFACGLLGESSASTTGADQGEIVVGTRPMFDLGRQRTDHRPPHGWVFESVDETAADADELIGTAWWTGSTEAIGGEAGRAEFARRGKVVAHVRTDHPRIAEDYDVEVADFAAACEYAVRLAGAARGFPVLIEVDTADQASLVAERLPGAVLLTEHNADRAAEILAAAGRRDAITVTSIRRREHDIEPTPDLNVAGGGLRVIALGTPPSLRAEQHSRLRVGRRGEHGVTWTVRYS